MGDMLTILKLTKEPSVSLASHIKPPTAKLSQLNLEITPQQFQKFRIDWDIFTKMTNLPTTQSNIYNCSNKVVQNSIINTYLEFFNTNPCKLLNMLEVLVTQKSNPMVHKISFLLIVQSDNESLQKYLIRLWSGAQIATSHAPTAIMIYPAYTPRTCLFGVYLAMYYKRICWLRQSY